MGADLFVQLIVGRRSTQDVPDEPAPTLKDHGSRLLRGVQDPRGRLHKRAHRDCLVSNCCFPAGVRW